MRFPAPTATRSPPSNPTPPISPVADKQILQPVPPSKRASTDAPPMSKTVEKETVNSIDSILANFKGVEKEEGTAFQTYFRQAILLFAASDAAPNPPSIPTHSRPAKGYKAIRENLPDKPAKIAAPQVSSAPIPIRARKQAPTSETVLPSKPIATENSWATVVRNCNGLLADCFL
ncbi:hypothetical protein K3495_g8222 [Podosphaera aphanis]|nr:hypothetical protein K3495_g8222 [Podosphaera aphanis]